MLSISEGLAGLKRRPLTPGLSFRSAHLPKSQVRLAEARTVPRYVRMRLDRTLTHRQSLP